MLGGVQCPPTPAVGLSALGCSTWGCCSLKVVSVRSRARGFSGSFLSSCKRRCLRSCAEHPHPWVLGAPAPGGETEAQAGACLDRAGLPAHLGSSGFGGAGGIQGSQICKARSWDAAHGAEPMSRRVQGSG